MSEILTEDDSITQKIKPTILSTQRLTKTYRMGRHIEVHALNSIDFNVWRGDFISIMGPSGSGKSTLLNLIGCLDRPTSGEIYIEGKLINQLSRGEMSAIRREKIGFIFQQYNLIPTLTALENVMLPLKYTGMRKRVARERAAIALEQVGLGDRVKHRPSELSGGEQQRVAVARSFVTEPTIILADEPTGELDSHTSEQIVRLLRALNESAGQTFIIVTHNPEVAKATDRVVKMRDGIIENDG